MIVTGPSSTVADNITITSVVASYSPGPTGDPYPLGYNAITLKFSKDNIFSSLFLGARQIL